MRSKFRCPWLALAALAVLAGAPRVAFLFASHTGAGSEGSAPSRVTRLASDRIPRQRYQNRMSQPRFQPRNKVTTPNRGVPDRGANRRSGYQAGGEDTTGQYQSRPTNWGEQVETRYKLWESVFAEPAQWLDLRQVKVSEELDGRTPDFRNKETGEQVWADSFFVPMWVGPKLEETDKAGAQWAVATRKDLQETLWQRLFDEPDDWLDFRPVKEADTVEASHPDFQSEAGGEQLFVGDPDMPDWVSEKLEAAGQTTWKVAGDSQLKTWQELFDEPEKWTDFRPMKAAGECVDAHPDFLQQWSGQAVWVEIMPPWALARLEAVSKAGEAAWPLAEKPKAPQRAERR